VRPYKMGNFPSGYNGEFNIYLNKNGKKILLATSDSRSPYYQGGLKYFAYTFYRIDEKSGEKNYLEEFPQKNELMEYMLKRTIEVLKSNNLLK
jgi:calcineurin-like phosphoesterase family protein